ncbi:MAG: GNAT family N-acetyltransferase, partial [Dechloromonas sp.]
LGVLHDDARELRREVLGLLRDRDRDGVMAYAQKFLSSPGRKDGLYWPTAAGEPPSPLGPLVGAARAQGYAKGDAASKRSEGGSAFHGYRYKILTRQGFHSAYAGIALPNDASVALHEAVGFEALGIYREVGFKHGRWHDVGWWRRALAQAATPSEPVRFSELDL